MTNHVFLQPPRLLPAPRSMQPRPGILDARNGVALFGDDAVCALAQATLAHLAPCRRLGALASPPDADSRAGTALPVLIELAPPVSTRHGAAAALQAEAYELDLDPGQQAIRLSASTAIGIRNGLRTLAQLLVQYRTQLPGVTIRDEPDFAVRGVMLDISRDRVPTMAHLRDLVSRLASWKINHLQLYTEHTFAYAGHEDVWRDASPMTAAEVRELDAWCAQEGIELSANQNCFGHLASWLRHPRYAPLAEIAADGSWDFNGLVTRTGPFSLCPGDPRSLDLIEDLLGQLLPLFTSSLVNIGCDETFDVGQGRSRDAVASRGRGAVYLEFVARVCAIAARHQRRPLFWADIALEHPEALSALPDDLIGLAWGYEADAPFARWCDQLRSAGRTVWVCPGTSCWRSITGRTSERRGNLHAAGIQGKAQGADGYLVTAWGDLGHRQQWPITLHALSDGAQRAWNAAVPLQAEAGSLHAFGDRSLALGSWLDDIGDLDLALRRCGGKRAADGAPTPLRNASALFTDLSAPLAAPGVHDARAWGEVAERLDALRPAPASGDRLIDDECSHTIEVVRLAVERALIRCHAGRLPLTRLDPSRTLMPEYRRLWALRSRPGGLERSIAHYQVLADECAHG